MAVQTLKELTHKQCSPDGEDIATVKRPAAEAQLKKLPGWRISHAGKRIRKDWTVKNFAAGLDFFERVGQGGRIFTQAHAEEIKSGFSGPDPDAARLHRHGFSGRGGDELSVQRPGRHPHQASSVHELRRRLRRAAGLDREGPPLGYPAPVPLRAAAGCSSCRRCRRTAWRSTDGRTPNCWGGGPQDRAGRRCGGSLLPVGGVDARTFPGTRHSPLPVVGASFGDHRRSGLHR